MAPKAKNPTSPKTYSKELRALLKDIRASESPATRGVRLLMAFVRGAYKEGDAAADNFLRCLFAKARSQAHPRPEEIPLPLESARDLVAAWLLVRALAFLQLLFHQRLKLRKDSAEDEVALRLLLHLGLKLKRFAASEVELAGNALLLFGGGTAGKWMLEAIYDRQFRKVPEHIREKLKADTVKQVLRKARTWDIAFSKGVGGLINWIHLTLSSAYGDVALKEKPCWEVPLGTEGATRLSRTEANAARDSVENDIIDEIYRPPEGQPDEEDDDAGDTDQPSTLPEPAESPIELSVRTKRRYLKAHVDIWDPAAAKEEQDRRKQRKRHRAPGHLSGHEMADKLDMPESTFRTLRKKAESAGWKPPKPINGRILFRDPHDLDYFKDFLAKTRRK